MRHKKFHRVKHILRHLGLQPLNSFIWSIFFIQIVISTLLCLVAPIACFFMHMNTIFGTSIGGPGQVQGSLTSWGRELLAFTPDSISFCWISEMAITIGTTAPGILLSY